MDEHIKFTNRCIPPFESGEYRVSVTNQTNFDCELSGESRSFFITSERFKLDSNEVYSVYPPRDTEGAYDYCLPHIILHRRTLPWERDVFGDNKTPWLVLMVFDEYEGVEEKCMSCEEALKDSEGIYVPNLIFQSYEDKGESCNIIDIPTSLFRSVIPTKDDLQYLAHGRGVNLDDKVTDSEVKSNWFSCVVSNRYSNSPVEEDQSIQHTAYLVSLEGYREYIESSNKDTHPLVLKDKVRIFTLTSWKYTMTKKLSNFAEIFKTLNPDVLKSKNSCTNENIKKLTKLGYYPLDHYFRDGSKLVSWYQPPLIPYSIDKKETKCHAYADELLVYDPINSMFDVTYQSAWQLGRMMAIASQPYAKALYMWRVNNKQKMMKQVEDEILTEKLYGNRTENVNQLNSMENTKDKFNFCLKEILNNMLEKDNIVADSTRLKGTKVESIWKGEE